MRLVLTMGLMFCGLTFAAAEKSASPARIDLELSNSLVRIRTLALKGRAMTEKQVAAAEARVTESPNEVAVRYRLLGWYAGKVNQKIFDARASHVLWFIEHRPEDPIFSTSYVQVDQRFEQKTFTSGMSLWKQHFVAQPKNTKILGHAARFALRNDRLAAQKLLETAKKIEPQNPAWPRRLAGLYQLQAFFNVGTAGVAVHRSAYAEWKNVYRLTSDESEKLRLLPQMAAAAWSAGDLEASRSWATQALESVAALSPQHLHGEAIHSGHRVLGQLALLEGEVEAAKEHLLASGRTPGSPRLNSFGPSMALAHDLSMQGERETVVQYLESCREFWVGADERIDEWIRILKDGDTPDFGNNLKL